MCTTYVKTGNTTVEIDGETASYQRPFEVVSVNSSSLRSYLRKIPISVTPL